MEIQRKAFEAYMADRYKNTVDQRVCINSDGDYMAWDMQVAWHVWQAAKAQAVPAEKNWDEIHLNPKERLYWSLRSAKKRKSDLNWYHASHQTCVGSTHGRKICEYLGVDPDGKDFFRKQEPTND